MVSLVNDMILALILRLAPRLSSALSLILIGRMFGPSEAGIFSLSTTYLLAFTAIMSGLDDLVVRQVSRAPQETNRYLISFLMLRLVLSGLSFLVLSALVLLVFDYARNTAATILILGLSLIPDNLTGVIQASFIGRRQFGPPAAVLSITSLLRLFCGVLVLATAGRLQLVAWVWCATSLLGMIVLLSLALRGVSLPAVPVKIRWNTFMRDWKTALTFLSITTLMTLEGQVGVLLLSAFRGEREVGWYGAAMTVAASMSLLPQVYQFSVYPLMTRYAQENPGRLSRLYRRSVFYLGAFALPAISGIAVLSPQITHLIFGPAFRPAADVLRALICATLFTFLVVPDSRMLLVHDRQRYIGLSVALSLLVNLILNLLLDPQWGALGTAIARLCSSALLFLTIHLQVVRAFTHTSAIRSLWKPAVATLAMAVVVLWVRAWPLPVTILTGVVVYLGTIWCLGGLELSEIRSIVRESTRRNAHSGSGRK